MKMKANQVVETNLFNIEIFKNLKSNSDSEFNSILTYEKLNIL